MRHVLAAFALLVLGLLGLVSATWVGTHPDIGRLVRTIVVGGVPPLCAAAFVVSLDLFTLRKEAHRFRR